MSFDNKVVIVTGGSSGIGAATAIIFASKGASVVIVGRNEANLNTVSERCGQVGKKAVIIKADVSKDDDAAAIINKTIDVYGKIDVLVNNAGILRVCGIMEKGLVGTFDEIMATNLRSIVLLTNLAASHLVKTKGNIVNVSSIAGSMQYATLSAYCMSKAALNHFSRIAAAEMAEHGVRVNTISPGPVDTAIFETSGSDFSLDFLQPLTALKKVSKPEEVGELIAYLASDMAGSITGSDFVIDCGSMVKK